jgi:hypothetical protein
MAAVDESELLSFMFTHKYQSTQCRSIQRKYRFFGKNPL